MSFVRKNRLLKLFFTMFLVVAFPVYVRAESFSKALINRVINDVYLYEDITVKDPNRRVAREKDILRPEMGLRTAPKSRAELAFKDGSLVRVGSDAMFSFTPSERNVQLSSGTALFQQKESGKKTQIQTATVTASITGTTVMMQNRPGDYQRAVVLEGDMTLSMQNNPQSQRTLNAGQMVVVPAGAQSLPEPINVDLGTLTQTSGLVNDFDDQDGDGADGGEQTEGESLDKQAIEEAIEEQSEKIEDGELERTNVVITEGGEQTELNSEEGSNEILAVDDSDQDLNEEQPTQNTINIDLSNSSDFEHLTGGDNIEFTGDGSGSFDLNNTSKNFLVDTENTDQAADITMDNLAINAKSISLTSRASGTIKIGDVNLEAQNAVELFAQGNTGKIQFIDNATLTNNNFISGDEIAIAANTVEVDQGVTVTLESGSGANVTVYADNQNYNVAGYGSINPGGYLGNITDDSFNNFNP